MDRRRGGSANPSYVENVKQRLANPGEFYYDAAKVKSMCLALPQSPTAPHTPPTQNF